MKRSFYALLFFVSLCLCGCDPHGMMDKEFGMMYVWGDSITMLVDYYDCAVNIRDTVTIISDEEGFAFSTLVSAGAQQHPQSILSVSERRMSPDELIKRHPEFQ